MRSLLISGSYFPPQTGGISTLMADVCGALGSEQVAVLTGVEGQSEDPRIAGHRVYRATKCFPPRTHLSTLRLAASLGYALARERPQFLQYATLEDAGLAYWTSRVLGLDHVFYVHGNEVLATMKTTWLKPKRALLAASAVIANSRYTAELTQRLGVDPRRVRVVHPGCDLQRFRRLPVEQTDRNQLTRGRPRAKVLLTIANLVERKGHDMVIKALAMLGTLKDEVVYLIAGAGDYRAELERLARSLGVAEQVIFLGRVPTEQLPLLLSMADAFIMPSRERLDHSDVEGFGIVFIEAAACGTPAIAGRSGGIEDAVIDNVTGLLVDPLVVEDVAHAIERLLTNPELASRLGEAGRRRAVQDFSVARFGREISDVLGNVRRAR